jgi:nucleoside-triphosphatase
MNILITGRPGVGKTTIIRRILQHFGEQQNIAVKMGGFTTQEMRRGGCRVGFSIRAVDTGQEGVLAHIDFTSPYRVARYGVNREDMERVGVAALRRAVEQADLIIMDEIGRMENYCPSFQSAVLDALGASQDVLGTLQMRSTPFLDGIRQRQDVILKVVTRENRASMPTHLLALLGDDRTGS